MSNWKRFRAVVRDPAGAFLFFAPPLFILVAAFLFSFSASAQITFHVRGDALTAYRSLGSNAAGAAQGTPAVQSSALTGAFGGSVIDLSGTKAISWLPRLNLPSGAISILIRFAPKYTGGKSASILNVNNGIGAWCSGIRLTNNGSDQPSLMFRNSNCDIVVNDTYSGVTLGTVTDQFMDLWIVWDGTSGAGKIKIYTAQNGNSPTLLVTGNADYAASRDTAVSGSVIMGAEPYISGADMLLNEYVVWDEAVNPASFGARTDFIPDTPLDGGNTTDPGESNVLSAVTYYVRGVLKTGTYDPTARFTDVDEDSVLDGVTWKFNSLTANRTGTYVEAAPGVVKTGTAFGPASAYTGTLTCTNPGESNVNAGTSYTIYDVLYTGTRQTVTNIMRQGSMRGQSTRGTLRAH